MKLIAKWFEDLSLPYGSMPECYLDEDLAMKPNTVCRQGTVIAIDRSVLSKWTLLVLCDDGVARSVDASKVQLEEIDLTFNVCGKD